MRHTLEIAILGMVLVGMGWVTLSSGAEGHMLDSPKVLTAVQADSPTASVKSDGKDVTAEVLVSQPASEPGETPFEAAQKVLGDDYSSIPLLVFSWGGAQPPRTVGLLPSLLD